MQLRDAAIEDHATITGLLASLGYPGTEDFLRNRIAQQIEHPDARLLVAVEESQVLGVISLHFIPQLALPGDFCRISYVCVSRAHRGRGIGTALEKKAVALARAHRCDRIEVHCHTRREAAHRFYHRRGYTEAPKYLVKSVP